MQFICQKFLTDLNLFFYLFLTLISFYLMRMIIIYIIGDLEINVNTYIHLICIILVYFFIDWSFLRK